MFSLKDLESEKQLIRASIAANLIELGASDYLISQSTKLSKEQIGKIHQYISGTSLS